jgi:hypothetical protein
MSRQREILVPQAILHAAHYFRKFGFSVLPQLRLNSISRYVRSKDGPFKIRIANHPPKHPDRYPDVLRSIVIREPMTQKEIETRCNAEFRVFMERLTKRKRGASASPSTDRKEGEP